MYREAFIAAIFGALIGVSIWGGRSLRRVWDFPQPQWSALKPPHLRMPTSERPRFWVDRQSVGKPYGNKVRGLLTFRWNPTRTYYGEGPVPRRRPRVLWSYPRQAMCAMSVDLGSSRLWCGTGWTGQPAVFERRGRTWVVFGAYDKAVHFVDAATGKDILPPFVTGDIIKGSVTIDPDGYPIVYIGSRDNIFRAIAFDRDRPYQLWGLKSDAVQPTLWNDDWDGAALVLDDHLFVGGENSQFHIVKLNRGYDWRGRVDVDPRIVFHAPGWDQDVLKRAGDQNMSIENSVAMFEGSVFFANSGGLAQGWDIRNLLRGQPPRRHFRYWTGDDVDASIVIDRDGALYIGAEYERGNRRSQDVGQIMKLAPGRSKDPLVWSRRDIQGTKSGVWATPALYRDLLVVATHTGRLLGLDKQTAAVRWELPMGSKLWQSPVIVDGILLQGDCQGNLRAFDVGDTRAPPRLLWTLQLPGCIESTPAVWKGRIYLGTRGGFVYAIGEGN